MSTPEPQPRVVAAIPQGGIGILGMHRSGTSLVAGLLHLCGVDLGPADRMMEPKPDNPGGFFEHLDIHAVNEHLLARLGGSWLDPVVPEDGWELQMDVEPLARRAADVLSRDFSSGRTWAFKDPRLCLLLPFWRRLVPGARFILCVRNPLDTASSLVLRNRIATGPGTRLWAQYNSAALLHSRRTDLHIVHVDRLLADPWRELADIAAFIDLPVQMLVAARPRIEEFVDPSRWHHRTDPPETEHASTIHPDARILYDAILEHSKTSTSQSNRRLETVADLVHRNLRSEDARRRASVELDRSRVARQRAEERLEATEGRLTETRDRLFEARTRIANLEKWLGERERDIRRQDLEIAKLEATLAELRDRLSAVLSSLGWQLLNRYRRFKDRILSSGRWAERSYAGIVERLRWRLNRRQSAIAPAPHRKWATLLDVATFERPPELSCPVVDPPPSWTIEPALPPVVVIVVNWNRRRYLEQCLESLFEETSYPHVRICVFDQASTDGSRDYLDSLGERIHAVHAPSNVGFVHANNVVMGMFPKWDLVLLNNDTRVTKGWLQSLVRTASSASNIGLVGAKLVYPDGRLQEAGSQLFADGSARALGRFDSPADPRYNQRRVVDFCSGACLYVKREVIDRCGELDVGYSPCYYEDADLALRARQLGYRALYEPRASVIHQEYGTSGREAALQLMSRNRERFVERWRDALTELPASLWQAPASERDGVLVIGDIVPAQDRSAGGSRLLHLLKILAERYDVTYAFLQDQMIEDYILPLERFGIRVFYPGYAKAIDQWELDLKTILAHNSYRCVICSLHTVAERYLGLVRQLSPASRLIVDTYDVHFLREQREAELRCDVGLARQAAATRDTELATYSRSDVVVTVTEEDRRALLRELPDLRVAIVPTIHDLAPHPRPRQGRRCDLLFVGGFSHLPNADAVLYFCREILPLVRRQIADLRLHVVGNAPSAEILALADSDVIVHGYVPHLRPFLDGCLASIAPLRYGSGMKGKIAEAMAHGLPVVTTSIGAEGMALRDRVDAMIANEPADFCQRIVELASDAKVWTRIADSGYARVAREWTPQVVAPRIFELLEDADSGP